MAISLEQYYSAQTTAAAQADQLIELLYFARSAAIESGKTVSLCATEDAAHCGGSWEQGQMVVLDSARLLYVVPGTGVGNRLVWQGSAGGQERIDFTSSGFTNGQRGTFYICSGWNESVHQKKVVLWDTGRAYVASMSLDEAGRYCR